jgi:hypothetical protein
VGAVVGANVEIGNSVTTWKLLRSKDAGSNAGFFGVIGTGVGENVGNAVSGCADREPQGA